MPTLGTATEITFTNLDGADDNDRDQSAEVDLGTSGADGVWIEIEVTPSAGTGDATGYVIVKMAESDDGTDYSGAASGSDATYAPTGEAQQFAGLRLVGVLPVDGTTTTKHRARFFVPHPARYFSIVTENQVGVALSSTAADNVLKYQTLDY